MMALLLNKYIFKPFRQNRSCESLLLNLFTCVDSLAALRRRNHNALRFELTKFPYPDTVDVNRHQAVKPRPPPAPCAQVKMEFQQEVVPYAWKRTERERTEGAKGPPKRPSSDDHFYNDEKDTDADNDTRGKVSKTNRSLESATVLSSGKAGLGQKFKGFFNSLKPPAKEDVDPMSKKMAMMQHRLLEHRKPETNGLTVAPTLMEQHEQRVEKNDQEQKKLHTLFKGQALRMAMHKEREKELTTSLERVKISKRMRYLMKLQHVMETKEPITDSALVPRHVPLYAELRSNFPDKKHHSQFTFAPYTPASPRSDNADFPHKVQRDTNGKSKKLRSVPSPSVGGSLVNRLCKGLALNVTKRNRY